MATMRKQEFCPIEMNYLNWARFRDQRTVFSRDSNCQYSRQYGKLQPFNCHCSMKTAIEPFITDLMWLCANKTLFMNTQITLYNYHIMRNYSLDLFQPMKNVKIILSLLFKSRCWPGFGPWDMVFPGQVQLVSVDLT